MRTQLILLFLAATWVVEARPQATVTAEDYARAEQFLREQGLLPK